MKSNILITTAAALLGSLAILTTGCETGMPMRQTGMNTMMVGGKPYTMTNMKVSPRTAQMISHRATIYKNSLSFRKKLFIKRHHVRYFAVDCPTMRTRTHGVPVVLYDIYTNRLVSRQIVILPTAPTIGRVMNINGWPAQYISRGTPMMGTRMIGSRATLMDNPPLFGSRM